MQEVIARAELVAETKSTVLITGETGTGKELVARAIHDRSAQRDMPLIKVNCAAIPETLLESELFGHVRGAFTGALDHQEGQVRAGRRRHDLPRRDRHDARSTLQAKLLRVLQEREFEPLGAERTAEGRRARDRRDQPRPAADGGRGQVPRGSVLPAQRHPDRDAAAARAAARTSRCWSSTSSASTRSAPASGSTASTRRRMAALQRLRLARQRARAGEHDRARGRAVDRRRCITARSRSRC